MLGATTPGRWSVMGLPDEGSQNGATTMRIAEVIGRVTLSRAESAASRRPAAARAAHAALGPDRSGSPDRGEELVVYDVLGAGAGQLDRPSARAARPPTRSARTRHRGRLLRVPDRSTVFLSKL